MQSKRPHSWSPLGAADISPSWLDDARQQVQEEQRQERKPVFLLLLLHLIFSETAAVNKTAKVVGTFPKRQGFFHGEIHDDGGRLAEVCRRWEVAAKAASLLSQTDNN